MLRMSELLLRVRILRAWWGMGRWMIRRCLGLVRVEEGLEWQQLGRGTFVEAEHLIWK